MDGAHAVEAVRAWAPRSLVADAASGSGEVAAAGSGADTAIEQRVKAARRLGGGLVADPDAPVGTTSGTRAAPGLEALQKIAARALP